MSNPGHSLEHAKYSAGEDHSSDNVAVLVSKWNPDVTHSLRDGAVQELQDAGVPQNQIKVIDVPGSYELPSAANTVINNWPNLDAVVCLGCVIQGETRHFEFICQSVAQGIKDVSLKHNIPVIFGVLTTDNAEQALARAGGDLGNKGNEAAVAALEMIDIGRMK